MITRQLYIDRIKPFINKPFVKVITGLRRSGKSVLLEQLKQELLNDDIKENDIIYINFESFEHTELCTSKALYTYIKNRISETNKYYILLDEIQEVEDWEKAINAFRVDFDCDIYITGSNSKLLSSELATYLAGRYIEISLYTLSFREYLQFQEFYHPDVKNSITVSFQYFIEYGGFPVIHTANYLTEQAYKIIYDIYSSTILRDTVQRHHIRDIELLERIVKFVFENIGHNFSAKKIADYFKSQYRKVDINTVYNYLNALEDAFIIYRIPRYDIKGKEILKTNEKYFVGDLSLLYAVMGYKDRLIGGALENIVLLELKRRNYEVYVGKMANLEIDFIAEKDGQKIYVQVAYKMTEQSTIDREFTPLLKIKDNYPKYVVSTENSWKETLDGAMHVNIAEFLLMDTY